MRHRVYGKHFSRNKDERDLLFKSLVRALFLHGTIEISLKKATAVKGLVDKLVNNAKNKNRNHLLRGYLSDKKLRERLIKEIAPKLGNRNSGYTSLVKLGQRAGDSSLMVRMSLIGAEELKPIEKETIIKQQETKPVEKKVQAKPARKRASK